MKTILQLKKQFIILLLFLIASNVFGQVASDVPTTGLTAPIIGTLTYQYPPTSCPWMGQTTWGLCQHQSGGHVSNGGINQANDTYAWDCNLSNNLDAGVNVYPVEDGWISHLTGWNGSSYGQLLIRHVTDGKTWYSGYIHMNNITSLKATNGAFVSKNDIIGTISNVSPATMSDHLHFAVYYHNGTKLVSVNRTFNERVACNVTAPVLNSPTDTQTNVSTPINFSWNLVNNANAYRLSISTSPSGFDPTATPMFPGATEFTGSTGFNSYSWTGAQPGTTYYWAVRTNVPGCGAATSTVRSFTTANPNGTCIVCPSYDFSPSINSNWSTHSSSFAISGCKIYRFLAVPGRTYTFKTGCGDGATADFDTYMELKDNNCNNLTFNDDGCSNNTSIIQWTCNYSSSNWVYLNIFGYGPAFGSYTLAYQENQTLGNEEFDLLESEISVYPNPTKDIIAVNSNSKIISKIELYDLQGRLILNKSYNTSKIDLDLSFYTNGTYLLKIYSESSMKTFKIMKN